MRQVKLAGTLTFVSPVEQEFAIGRKLCDAIVAVAVADIERAVGGERDVGGFVEMSRVKARNAFRADS